MALETLQIKLPKAKDEFFVVVNFLAEHGAITQEQAQEIEKKKAMECSVCEENKDQDGNLKFNKETEQALRDSREEKNITEYANTKELFASWKTI